MTNYLALNAGGLNYVVEYTPPTGVPELPREYIDTTYALPTGATVYAYGDEGANGLYQTSFSDALRDAVLNTTIVLKAGSVYTCPENNPWRLNIATGSGWVYIISSDLASLPAGARVTPADNNHMPILAAPDDSGNGNPVLFVYKNAHHYRFCGIEFRTSHVRLYLVLLGSTLPAYDSAISLSTAATTLVDLPSYITFDRCYFTSTSASAFLETGMNLNGSYLAVIDSHFDNIKSGSDSQAICIYNGPGPYKIVNSYLEASGENIMSGGTDPPIADLVPADMEITHNYFFKRREWDPDDVLYGGVRWTIKNLFELKNAERVLLDYNTFENCHHADQGQNGRAIVLTPRNQSNTAPWCAVRDITITNNRLLNMGAGILVMGSDYIHPSAQTQRILISNNLWTNINRFYYGVNVFLEITASEVAVPIVDLTVKHNTALFGGADTGLGTACIFTDTESNHLPVVENFICTDNIMQHANYGVFYGVVGEGAAALELFADGYTFAGNLLITRSVDRTHDYDLSHFAADYPVGNWMPDENASVGFVDYANGNYRLAALSIYKNGGTDGTDPGVNQDNIPEG
jgi:hypothetical protein